MSNTGTEVLSLDRVWRQHRRWKRRPMSLKEALIRQLKGQRSEYEDFWVLRGVSLSVRAGACLGICGPNGAGKSTMLKLIARILPADHGRITVRGRIAPLLELGAGFLPDLTGRENVLLNGAILGLRDGEIRRKIDTILEFADLGDFIDSPVWTYSTGMYARLGFAIASHVEADILLLDEILVVGDASFQAKCEDWLTELRGGGTTVVVVSHDLNSLVKLCDRVIWLDDGRIVQDGGAEEVVNAYRLHETGVAAEPAEVPHP